MFVSTFLSFCHFAIFFFTFRHNMQAKQQFLQCKSKLEGLHPPIYIWGKARRHRGKWHMTYSFEKLTKKGRATKPGKEENLFKTKSDWSQLQMTPDKQNCLLRNNCYWFVIVNHFFSWNILHLHLHLQEHNTGGICSWSKRLWWERVNRLWCRFRCTPRMWWPKSSRPKKNYRLQ